MSKAGPSAKMRFPVPKLPRAQKDRIDDQQDFIRKPMFEDLWSDLWSNRRDWNFAKSGKLSTIFQKLYRGEDPAKRSSQTEGNVSSPFHPQQTLVSRSNFNPRTRRLK
jgi:hypothetical protein